jgi:hypothetical protein
VSVALTTRITAVHCVVPQNPSARAPIRPCGRRSSCFSLPPPPCLLQRSPCLPRHWELHGSPTPSVSSCPPRHDNCGHHHLLVTPSAFSASGLHCLHRPRQARPHRSPLQTTDVASSSSVPRRPHGRNTPLHRDLSTTNTSTLPSSAPNNRATAVLSPRRQHGDRDHDSLYAEPCSSSGGAPIQP